MAAGKVGPPLRLSAAIVFEGRPRVPRTGTSRQEEEARQEGQSARQASSPEPSIRGEYDDIQRVLS